MSNEKNSEGRRKRRGGLRVPSDNVPRRLSSDSIPVPVPEPVGLAASISESFGVAPDLSAFGTSSEEAAKSASAENSEEHADLEELPTIVSEPIGGVTLPMEPITMEEEETPVNSAELITSGSRADTTSSPERDFAEAGVGESVDIPFDESDETTLTAEIPTQPPGPAVEVTRGEAKKTASPEIETEEPELDTVVDEAAVLPRSAVSAEPKALGKGAGKKKPRFARALTMALNESDLEEVLSADAVPKEALPAEESGDVLVEEELEEVADVAKAAGKDAEPPPPPPPKSAPTKPGPTKSAPANQAPAAPAKPEEKKRRRAKPWFEEIFDEDYLRTLPFLTPQATQFEANFVMESLGVEAGAQILDVGCGYGRHAMELSARGYHMVGLDSSLPLLLRGADEAQRRGLTINFVHADMREMTFESQFDGAYCLFSSFGYFDDETNKRTAQNIAKALKPGARFVVDVLNRDYLVADLPSRVWWEGDGCVVLEEVEFNYFSSRIASNRSVVFDDGRQLEQEISLRSFSLHELGKFLHAVGFRVLEISGSMSTRGRFFGAHSRDIVVVAERRSD